MRWHNLFSDLEAQIETVLDDESVDFARDSERARRGSQTLAECLVDELIQEADRGPVKLFTAGVCLWITVDNFGSDWISGEVVAPAQHSGYCIVNLSRVDRVVFTSAPDLLVGGSPVDSHRVPGGVARRLGRVTLRIVLRDLVRRRKSGWLMSADANAHGTLDRVGKDFVELAEHAPTAARRQESIESRLWLRLSEMCFFRIDD
jgi:hypothetical protein